jgi:homoserine/homoserine lactone efflux protein
MGPTHAGTTIASVLCTMRLEDFFLYLATWSLVALTPGPAVMCAMSQATRHGFRASLAGVLGTQAGNLVFFICTALGLATLLKAATTAFTILQVVGAAYLCSLGVRIIVFSFRRSAAPEAPPAFTAPVNHSLFLQGLAIQLTNPKALLFVSALLPQFIDPQRPVLVQLLILVAVTIAVNLVVLSSWAFFAERGVRSFRAAGLSVWLERVFGAALLLFGFRLLLSRK